MKVLYLTLKGEYFDRINSGRKRYEFREVKPYWTSRLMKYHTTFSTQRLKSSMEIKGEKYLSVTTGFSIELKPKHFDLIHFRHGYSAHSRTMTWECAGITQRRYKGKDYYVIALGNRTELSTTSPVTK